MSENRNGKRRESRLTRLPRSLHSASEELALYVIDGLDRAQKEELESHVGACEACAEALAREASVEAAFGQVASLASERSAAEAVAGRLVSVPSVSREASRGASIVPAMRSPEARARLVSGGRRSRWAGGVGGALAAAAALVLAFASATARSEPAGVAQRAPGLHDAAGDMSGAFGAAASETVLGDTLDGG